MREIARRTGASGKTNLTIANKKIGMNPMIVFTIKPLKKAQPRRLRKSAFTSFFVDGKELYFNLIRDTVSEWLSVLQYKRR